MRKTFILTLTLIIFSVTGLPAEEISQQLDQLNEEATQAFYAADYPTALEKWEAGLKKAREIGDKDYISKFIGNLGVVYDDLGQYQKALDYHQQALKIRREIGDRRGEARDFGNIGLVYDNLGQYQKALDYYRQALSIDRDK